MIEVCSRFGTYSVNLESVDRLASHIANVRAVVIDENVQRLWSERLRLNAPSYVVPSGESSKSVSEFGKIQDFLAKLPLSRSDRLAVVGGGVVGDLGGFVAATYMRGVRYVQVPTTLLAMVDSSVGGKVAIDLDAGKNLVGSFYPPSEVLISLDFLQTLPPRQIKNGMAEVFKYAFILDSGLIDKLVTSEPDYPSLIPACVKLKAKVVQEDEYETNGLRAILNFGHTVGHAIESALEYRDILHGEAVAIGMAFEARLGERLGLTESGTADEVASLLEGAGFSLEIPEIDPDTLLRTMRRDKKASRNGLAFALLERIGACKLVDDIPESLVREVLT